MRHKIGISRMSTLRYKAFSCSGVKFGGGGKDVSPPKSNTDSLSESPVVSECFSSDTCSMAIISAFLESRLEPSKDFRVVEDMAVGWERELALWSIAACR